MLLVSLHKKEHLIKVPPGKKKFILQIGRHLPHKYCIENIPRIILFPVMKVCKFCQQGVLEELEAFPDQQLQVPENNNLITPKYMVRARLMSKKE